MKALAAGMIAASVALGAGPGANRRPADYCAPHVAGHRLAFLLDAFNGGRALAFARGFTHRGRFEPYNGGPRRYSASTHRGIERIVRARHRAGDRWLFIAAQPPVNRGADATYGLRLRVVRRAARPYEKGVKVIVVCASGRVRVWLGPVWS